MRETPRRRRFVQRGKFAFGAGQHSPLDETAKCAWGRFVVAMVEPMQRELIAACEPPVQRRDEAGVLRDRIPIMIVRNDQYRDRSSAEVIEHLQKLRARRPCPWRHVVHDERNRASDLMMRHTWRFP